MTAVEQEVRSQESGVRSNRAPAPTFEDLIVWQKSHAWVWAAYCFSDGFPPREIYGLTSQMRRAATSIPTNVAEGYGRETTGAYIQFLRVSQGSLKELETLILLVEKVETLETAKSELLMSECERVGKMLRNLIRALQAKQTTDR